MDRAMSLRGTMVDALVSRRDVRSPRVEAAFRTVPRHLFVPDVPLEAAYSQEAIITRRGPDGNPASSSSMPAIMAQMVEQLDVWPGHRVLEIGAGTGYNAAILAALVGPDGEVTTIDLDEVAVGEARAHLDAAGYAAVCAVSGDGWLGAAERAPYDRIEATVGVSDLSPAWIAQLRDGGRLVAPLWLAGGKQLSIAFQKERDRLCSVAVAECGFMRLRGPHAGPETFRIIQGWTVSLDEPDPARLAALNTLLALDPHIEAAPPGPEGWRTRLLLEDRRAIFLGREENWRHMAHGVLEIGPPPSLAIVTARAWTHALHTFGGDAAREILLRRLADTRPLDIHDLMIEALPAAAPPPQGGTVIRRPNFQFVIREQ